ncbi:hypothetical protein EYB53_002620 [Candidatus Chloroploca sp. M-50]|uniref:KOW domain-containing protein n=1 Tax=Candidatus Chloroploca mongolica TaxID=2528176 RepID=A0ABS4D579_9CHLR|nr:hypothetical protein [Candidatus Chloroploca mongolica]MBP1464595.1 hypothetical protein [Candidatus Chloroploca mongolica]
MLLHNPEGMPPIVSSVMARIERRLPYPGQILVRQGSRVEPEDTIARTLKPLPPYNVNLARVLRIAPDQLERALLVQPNSKVEVGQILARAPGIFGHTYQSPVNGVVMGVDAQTGYLTLAPDPIEQAMHAAVRGVVMEVRPYEGVVIETLAAQIYGAFGCGEERSGVLRLMALEPSDIVRPDQIDARSAYAVLICGATMSAAALQRAVEAQVRGIIVGSLEEAALREFLGWSGHAGWRFDAHSWQWPAPRMAHDLPLTLVVTEGFGVRPMNQEIFEQLSLHDGQEALIDGHTILRRPLRRPRVVIPLGRANSAQLEPPSPHLRPGVKVRLLDAQHLGQTAVIRSLPAAPRRVASGMRLPAVEVIAADQTSFWLPQSCVEVLG